MITAKEAAILSLSSVATLDSARLSRALREIELMIKEEAKRGHLDLNMPINHPEVLNETRDALVRQGYKVEFHGTFIFVSWRTP